MYKNNLHCLPYQEVYSTNKEFVIEGSVLKVGFRGMFYRFEQLVEVFPEREWPAFWEAEEENPNVVIQHFYHAQVAADGFRLKVQNPLQITIETSDLRGFRYGMEALEQLIMKSEHCFYLKEAEINHEPSFEIRGVIEGFYGTPWTLQDRLDVLEFLKENKLNTYMYAPKDDEFQRKRWREPYPAEKLAEFELLLQKAQEEEIDFYYMISPGNDIDYTQEAEVAVLTGKLQQMIDLGITRFGLLLDDIDYVLKGAIQKKFQRAAHAHTYLINQVNTYLKNELADYQLIACPTEYDNRYGSPYLETLAKETAPEVPFFWTGPSTLASAITTEDIEHMQNVYRRPIVIWDNVPVNDYQADHELVFLSPYENRSPKLADPAFQVKGIVSNPMAQWELSKIMVGTMAEFLWDSRKYQSEKSLASVLEQLYGKESVEPMQQLIAFHPNKYMREAYPASLLEKIKQKEISWMREQLEELLEAGRKAGAVLPEQAGKQLAPWLQRAEQEWLIWEDIENNHFSAAAEKLQELKGSAHRLGVSLPVKYLELHQTAEETVEEL